MLLPKYQRFVAWRYLLERERTLSSAILGVVGFCMWIAAGMTAASLWFPLADITKVPPPNPPSWLIAIIGLSTTLPVIGLAAAGLARLRGAAAWGWLALSLNWAALSWAVLGLYQRSMSERGITDLDMWAGLVLYPELALGVPLIGGVLWRWHQGRPASSLGFSLALMASPLGLLSWAFTRIWRLFPDDWPRLRVAGPVVGFAFALQLVALLIVLAAAAYAGGKQIVWPTLFPEAGLSSWGKAFALSGVLFVLGGGVFVAGWIRGQRRSAPLAVALSGLALALTCGTGAVFVQGVHEVGVHLDFLGGWQGYTPPMALVIPAMFSAALAILSSVLLLVRYLFTFFTTVSIGGVTIGTMALVIVLSVMSGFENDLREKILGFNAHIQISRTDELQFEGYQAVHEVLEKTPGVVGYTPFLTTEAYMSNHNNYGNVWLKGIDPARVAGVTEIVHKLEPGDERALEKIWPLNEDGTIAGRPRRLPGSGDGDGDGDGDGAGDADWELDEGPIDFSGGAESADELADDDFELGGPEDFSGGLEEYVDVLDAGVGDAGIADGFDPAEQEDDWDTEMLPHDYVSPSIAVLDGLLVGKELVKQINLYTDQEVRVISPLPDISPDGASIPRIKDFRVAGKFFSGMYEYDLKYVYLSLHALQQFLDLGDEVNGIEVRVKDPRKTGAIVAELEAALGPGYRVQDWKQLNRALFSALKLEKIAMFFVLVIIVLVASFSIVGNLIMVVIEKAKEIAILKTLGSSDAGVMKIFITQGFFIGLVGTSLGVALGLGACYLGQTYGVPLDPDVYYIDKLPIQVEGWSVLAVGFAGLAISVVATIYPAFIASSMQPVKGLRWD